MNIEPLFWLVIFVVCALVIARRMTGPIVGIVSGVVLGLFAFIASKLVKPTLA